MALYQLTVSPSADGLRIDAFLRRFLPEVTPQTLRSCFDHRDVKLDGKRVKPDVRVTAGQQVAVYCMEQTASPLTIVYEDADVLLINKRAGVSVEPDEKGGVSLTELALRHVQSQGKVSFAPVACHRLDNQTCGLTLFAKNQRASEVLRRAFKDRSMDKRYTCLVKGQMKPPAATCHAFLVKDAKAARVTILDHETRTSRPIITAYETLSASPTVSRLLVHLITGRTHQIRAHMAALGHPLLGDDVYGDRSFNRTQKVQGKLMLCASQLTLQTGGALPQLDGKTFKIDCPF